MVHASRRPRFGFPASARRLRNHGDELHSNVELRAAIETFIERWNLQAHALNRPYAQKVVGDQGLAVNPVRNRGAAAPKGFSGRSARRWSRSAYRRNGCDGHGIVWVGGCVGWVG